MIGFKSADNTVENIQTIESTYNVNLPIVSFIFDPWSPDILDTINKLPSTLGDQRIYHITLSPNDLSAQQVLDGAFDSEYTQFFKAIKKNNLKVVFRTMHEMNGGRYPRSSNPSAFKKAWIHVWNMSRKVGLGTGNIQFDFSVNHRDMPTKETPKQTAKLIQCQPSAKIKLNCFTFEDYYPGDTYVDIVGFTFYNRGKATSSRLWLTPQQIVNEKGRNTLDRVKKFKKPIMIDEVGTTAVRYETAFDFSYSRQIYNKEYANKNTRINQLQTLLKNEPSIIGAVYFNVDYTNGLDMRLVGEADRSVINPEKNKVYNAIFDLIKNGENIQKRSTVANMFGLGGLSLNGITKLLPIANISPIKKLRDNINKNYSLVYEKIASFNSYTGSSFETFFPKLTGDKKDEVRGQASYFIPKLPNPIKRK
ncbi:MAG: glycosyl hydrolase [Candidatus Absconditabacteria bacterium]